MGGHQWGIVGPFLRGRLRDSARFRTEAVAARAHGLPHSILLGRPWPAQGEPLFLPEDTDLAVALAEQEAAEEAERCPMCGLSREVCRDPANQFQFVASAEQCHASYAIALAQGKQSDQSDAQNRAISWSAYLRH